MHIPTTIRRLLRLSQRGMVGVGGFEPPTSWSQTKRASHCATPRQTLFHPCMGHCLCQALHTRVLDYGGWWCGGRASRRLLSLSKRPADDSVASGERCPFDMAQSMLRQAQATPQRVIQHPRIRCFTVKPCPEQRKIPHMADVAAVTKRHNVSRQGHPKG